MGLRARFSSEWVQQALERKAVEELSLRTGRLCGTFTGVAADVSFQSGANLLG